MCLRKKRPNEDWFENCVFSTISWIFKVELVSNPFNSRIIYSVIHEKGLKGYIHSYVEPMPMMAAINILELFTRPLSLCMRLFGNVLGAFVLMELITHIAPAIVPLPFSCYFDFFDGLLQAYVFILLTSLFISESIE